MNTVSNTPHSHQSAKPQRVLIFSLVYYPHYVGGAEIAVKEITDRISPEEVEFDMVTLNGGGELPVEKIGNVTVYRIAHSLRYYNKILYPIRAYLRAVKLHRQNKYHTAWAIMANAGFAALFFKLHFTKVRFVLTLQEGDPFSKIKRRIGPMYPLFKQVFRRADHITAISRYLGRWARDMGATAPIDLIPNAVDIELFERRNPVTESRLREKLGKKEGDIFLITTSRLVLKNAVGDIIAALSYLPEQVKLIILGNGPLEAELKTQVNTLKLFNRVHFLGYIPHVELPPYLHISDIFVRPSLSEGLGNSFLEAMAAGLPVIATNVGGITDFLTDGQTGLVCEVGNPKSIAQKVEKLMKDKESREYIVGEARTMVKERYEWGKVSGEMKGVLSSL
jgi:glycosyltransferase involved in cell wall biosynthesis